MPISLSLLGHRAPDVDFVYTWKDTVLYALGVGAKRDELDFLYEGRGPKVLPSFAVVPGFSTWFEIIETCGGDMSQLVHGTEKIRLHDALPPNATLRVSSHVSGLHEKGALAFVVITTELRTTTDAKLATLEAHLIFRTDGGFGGTAPPSVAKLVELPTDRAPDFEIKEAVSPEQALIYRLSGDVNPLHADPDYAKTAGFDRGPILHGLGTLGFMTRHAAKGGLDGDATRIRAVEAQFRKPVWPGDVLVTKGYRVGATKLALEVSVEGREGPVLANAGVEYV